MFSTNEQVFEVFLTSNKGKELVQAAARKARRRSTSEGDSAGFKCWYYEKEGHTKRDCPTLAEDKNSGAVKRHPWRNAEFKGKEEDQKKKTGKVKPEKVNVAKQEDSGSDSSWFVRDAWESFEEDAEWVTGNGIEDEDISEAEDEDPKNQENSITYFTRQSSTRTEAVARYVELPVLNHCVQLLTPLCTPGPEKININPEGRHNDEKIAENKGYEQPEKRDVMVDINPEGEHDEEKTVGKQQYEQQAETDPGEHFVKGDELEDASEDTSKIVEKEKVEEDEASTHWEDVKKKISREEEAEEKFDDDDRGEDDRELFIKGDGFEDDSENTAEEEIMKQVEVPKSRKGIKKELSLKFK
jgi:hypothetical protein